MCVRAFGDCAIRRSLPWLATANSTSDPRTLEFHGVERVWVKATGSVSNLSPASTAKMKRDYDSKNRETEEGLYDPDIDVLWQAKAWADTVTCIE